MQEIIVVGEQFSGKSSILEALSGIRFNANKDSHTRFATELVLRRGSETAVKVSIRFADHSPTKEQDQAAQQLFQESRFDKDTLPGIIARAGQLVGIGEGGTKISKDVLRVEVTAPTLCSLTLIDLPGFSDSAAGDPDAGQEKIIQELNESYMRQPENIILAVVTAGSSLASQVVLQKAKRHDPNTELTIGLISKPDLAVADSSDEQSYVDLARDWQNKHQLALGWHVLLNRPQQDLPLKLTPEWQFFHAGASCSATLLDCGVENLQSRLWEVLLEKTKDPEALRSYLLGIAEDFHRLARDGIEGRYSDAFFGDLDPDGANMKLRAVVRNLNRVFAVTLSTKGARYKFEWDGGEADKSSESNATFPDHLQPLFELYNIAGPETITGKDLETRLRVMASDNQGTELPGMPNGDLVFRLFKLQAERWRDIAQFHLDQVLNFTKAFVENVIGFLAKPNQHTTNGILASCVDPFLSEKKETLQTKLQELLLPYMSGYGLSFEEDVYTQVSRKRKRNHAARILDRLEKQHPQPFGFGNRQAFDRNTALSAIVNSEDFESDEFGADGVVEMMLAHYQMSMRTFIDNVINLAIESCLLRHIPSILTPRKVGETSTDSVNKWATESQDIREKRQKLQKEVNVLQEALLVCNAHKPRELTDCMYHNPNH
ncbi:hypothetical protein NEMBOFW57_010327 [Staphylotrichum longicolle]|uniref:GED domain-containing protein n=1 Tax=Staphylotrichum longicolle TaxID=669026 RepID=A0AAD4HSY6_9PEZI|nr:hypothetical protein NEMBOFW57_010327 [Staphylotrichum longicolle]